MSKLNGRKVIHASLHEGTFLPGLGSIPKDLSPSMVGDVRVLSMVIDAPFVLVTFRNVQGVQKDFAFDSSLFKHLALETDPKPLILPTKE